MFNADLPGVRIYAGYELAQIHIHEAPAPDTQLAEPDTQLKEYNGYMVEQPDGCEWPRFASPLDGIWT